MTLPTIAPTTRSSLPTVPTRAMADLVGKLGNRLEMTPSGAAEICDAVAPTDDERGLLQDRIGALNQLLVGSKLASIEGRVGALLSGFPTYGADAQTAAMNGKLIVSALQRFPLWVVDTACQRVRDGDAGLNRSRAPTAPELAHLCREIVGPVLSERGQIERILTARLYSLPAPEERERVQAGFNKLVGEMREHMKGERFGHRAAERSPTPSDEAAP